MLAHIGSGAFAVTLGCFSVFARTTRAPAWGRWGLGAWHFGGFVVGRGEALGLGSEGLGAGFVLGFEFGGGAFLHLFEVFFQGATGAAELLFLENGC